MTTMIDVSPSAFGAGITEVMEAPVPRVLGYDLVGALRPRLLNGSPRNYSLAFPRSYGGLQMVRLS